MRRKDSLKEKMLQEIFIELDTKAYNPDYHNYSVKETNQIIRKYFEILITASEQCQKRDELTKAYQEFVDFYYMPHEISIGSETTMGQSYPDVLDKLEQIRNKIEQLKKQIQ